ncbi:MAG TPA: mechanosensitive ion channel family protein [Dehalococcoidia bacterium]|nr:mechanosensitive ion channel family protein [Dehalococcoidia bacterium]
MTRNATLTALTTGLPHRVAAGAPLWLRPAQAQDWLSTHGLRILVIVVALGVVQLLIRRLAPHAIQRAIFAGLPEGVPGEREKRARTLSGVTVKVSGLVLFFMGLFMVLEELGYSLTPVVTGIGISGIAIGLGAQGLVKDTINGLFILGENQFRQGDYVTVAGVSGTVEDINLRRTLLRDIDGTVHTVPNGAIQIASNHTRDYSGVNILVLIALGADLDRALAVAERVGNELAAEPRFAADIVEPPHPARIESIDEKGVTLRVLGRVRPGRAGAVTFEYRRLLKLALDAEGIRYAPVAALAPEQSSAAGAAGNVVAPGSQPAAAPPGVAPERRNSRDSGPLPVERPTSTDASPGRHTDS